MAALGVVPTFGEAGGALGPRVFRLGGWLVRKRPKHLLAGAAPRQGLGNDQVLYVHEW